MLRVALIVAGWLFILIGCVLLAFTGLRQVSNFAERNYIRDHHTYSTPGAFQWSDWQPNDGSVTHFEFGTEGHEQREKLAITEFRRGRTHGVLFDFVAYEGRSIEGAASITFPAYGPDWGAHYNRIWAVSAFALGIILIFVSKLFKSPGNGDVVT
ncbi:hypothetical protein [Roseimicrobium sp. ORNL1]|uniref:hypothetical protein n=1 Tax=Roseimicrobium sp. ORNL1 TaxID=2711231 RepID=UPI0019806CE2|nr:hypothetical protein [Roseimicrobium sp. ORNL1]